VLYGLQRLYAFPGLHLGTNSSRSLRRGLEVQLVAVEHHAAGLVLTLEARATPGALPPAAFARVSVNDDAGTAYRAAGQGQGGSQEQVRYLVTVLPAPP